MEVLEAGCSIVATDIMCSRKALNRVMKSAPRECTRHDIYRWTTSHKGQQNTFANGQCRKSMITTDLVAEFPVSGLVIGFNTIQRDHLQVYPLSYTLNGWWVAGEGSRERWHRRRQRFPSSKSAIAELSTDTGLHASLVD